MLDKKHLGGRFRLFYWIFLDLFDQNLFGLCTGDFDVYSRSQIRGIYFYALNGVVDWICVIVNTDGIDTGRINCDYSISLLWPVSMP